MQVALHRHITVILAAMQDVGKAGVGATADIWLLKALAQLVDLRIYDANQAAFVRAERILMPGEPDRRVPLLRQLSECFSTALW